jgi:uncharacterized protein
MSIEAVTFKNSQNQDLVGVMHHAIGNGLKPCIILCHGYAGTKLGGSRRSVEFARIAAEGGISVFRFDFAGSGDSDGDLTELTLDNEVDDLISAISKVETMDNIDKSKIGLVGHCMGAVTVIRTASRDHRIYRSVAWAPFTDLDVAVKGTIGDIAYELVKNGEITEFLYNEQIYNCGPKILVDSDKYNLFEELKGVKNPLRIIHGTNDSLVPVKDIISIVQDLEKEGIKRELVTLKNAHHSFPFHKEELFDLTLQWFTN